MNETKRRTIRTIAEIHGYRVNPSPFCLPGDTETAGAYWAHLKGVLDATRAALSHGQYTYLTRRIRIWRRRAQGGDARFNIRGSQSGTGGFRTEWVIWRVQREMDGYAEADDAASREGYLKRLDGKL